MTPKEPTAETGDGRVVLITGGTRGIGLACARWFLERGDRVAVTSRSGAVDGVVADPDDVSGRFLSLTCDVTDSQQVDAAFSTVEETWGPVEVLVANAGITRDTLIPRMSDSDWDDVITTNLRGTFLFTRAATRIMMQKRYGRVINISSVSGLIGNPGQSNYSASKAGMIGMTRTVAKELAGRKMTVNAIAPGFIETEMTGALGEVILQEVKKRIPAKRFGQPEEIAYAVLFLASDAAAYITGQVLTVDGGMC